MRKHLAIILFIVFIYNVAGFYTVFQLRQHSIHSKTEALRNDGSGKEGLTLLKFSKEFIQKENNGIYWEDHKEFRYRGNWYDVVKKVVSGETVLLYCYHDKKEDELFNDLKLHIAKQLNYPGTSGQEKNDHIVLLFKNYLPAGDKFNPSHDQGSKFRTTINLPCTQPASRLPDPPPKII